MFLENETQFYARPELEMGETLLGSGKPDPYREMLTGFAIWFFAIPWTAFSIFWIWGAAGPGMGRPLRPPGLTMEFLFPFFGLPFLLIGFAMLSAPFFAFKRALRTIYAITDKRILIIEIGNVRSVQTYERGDVGNIQRKERADRSGDLTFAQKAYKDSDGDLQTKDIQFVGIPEVRHVEQLIRDTFKVRTT